MSWESTRLAKLSQLSMRPSSTPRIGDSYVDVTEDCHAHQYAPATASGDAAPIATGNVAPVHPCDTLRARCGLSPSFRCSSDDAEILLSLLAHTDGDGLAAERLEQLEGQVKHLSQRLRRADADIERVKNELSDARAKQAAVETQSKTNMKLASQRREESRKLLLVEEGRAAKLEFQNRTLASEVEKLKARVHQLLSKH